MRDDARRAEALIDGISDGHERLTALLAFGVLLQDLYVADEAASDGHVKLHTTFSKAADLAEGLGDRRAQSRALGHLAKLHFAERRYSEAIDTASRALFWSERSTSPDLTYRWQWQLARIYAAQGQVGDATHAYDAAIDALRRVQSSLIAERADPANFRKLVDPIFSEYATFLLNEAERAATVDDARRLLEKTQTSFDKLKSIELANYFRDRMHCWP